MKRCPKCLKAFNDSAVYCDLCGIELAFEADLAPQNNNMSEESTEAFPQEIIDEDKANNSDKSSLEKKHKKQKRFKPLSHKKKIIAIAAAAVFIVAVIASGTTYALCTLNNKKAATAALTQSSADVDNQALSSSKTTTKAATSASTTINSEIASTEQTKAFDTYGDFYKSYIDAVNHSDKSYLKNCTSHVKSVIAKRFSINSNSKFVLQRIDFDKKSYSSVSKNGEKIISFYTKNVSELYARSTEKYKETNYAIWKVTVSSTDGKSYIISGMERNDSYSLSSNVFSKSYNTGSSTTSKKSSGSNSINSGNNLYTYDYTTVRLTCSLCGGSGRMTCFSCHGMGYTTKSQYVPGYGYGGGYRSTVQVPCSYCHGTGLVTCSACHGSGKVN